MSRRPAAVTQADVRRAIRAAKQEGWHSVRVTVPGGATIEIAEAPVIHSDRPAEEKLEPLESI